MSSSKLKKYLIAGGIAAIVTFCLLFVRDVFTGTLTLLELVRSLADAFSSSGMLLLAVFCLACLATQGLFDGLGYVGSVAARSLMPGMRFGKYEKYGDYKVRKAENRMKVKDCFFLLFIGLAFLLVGIVFTIIFFFV